MRSRPCQNEALNVLPVHPIVEWRRRSICGIDCIVLAPLFERGSTLYRKAIGKRLWSILGRNSRASPASSTIPTAASIASIHYCIAPTHTFTLRRQLDCEFAWLWAYINCACSATAGRKGLLYRSTTRAPSERLEAELPQQFPFSVGKARHPMGVSACQRCYSYV